MEFDGIFGKICKVHPAHDTGFEATSHLSSGATAEVREVVIRIRTHDPKTGRPLTFGTAITQHHAIVSQHTTTVHLTDINAVMKWKRGVNSVLDVEPPEAGRFADTMAHSLQKTGVMLRTDRHPCTAPVDSTKL